MNRRHCLLATAAVLAVLAVPAGPIAGGMLMVPHAVAAAWLAWID
jgi:hypothetical protein